MSATSSTSADLLVPRSEHQDSLVDFVRWGLAQLKLSWEETADRATVVLDESDRKFFDGKERITLALNPGAETATSEPIALDGRFASWLLNKLRDLKPAVSLCPFDQPTSVNDVVARLFEAYQVDGGQVHLGGCQLDDLPFLRLTYANTDESGNPCVCHIFVAHDGTSVSSEQAEELGLLQVEPVLHLPPRIDEAALGALLSAGERIAVQSCSDRDPSARVTDPLVTALVWIKHASGKLQFTIDETTVELPFSGWAKLIQAPPYVSSRSGASSFHLAATDEGHIDALSEITQCEYSGRKVLRQDLVECSVTGKRVLEEFTRRCPVSGRPALEENFRACSSCGEEVSQSALDVGVCAGCRGVVPTAKNDPRLVWILSEHKGLESWGRWKIAETENVYIAVGSKMLRRLLVVVDKESLSVRHLATRGRIGSRWTPVAPAEFGQILA